MKSLREWIVENDVSGAAMRNVLGGTSVSVDPKLKSLLKTKIESIADLDYFQSMDKATLFREIIAAAASILGDMKGTRISTQSILNLIDNPHSEEMPDNVA